jgi:hypothetical protein
VALRAIRTHLPLVNIGVAILAILADIGEYRFDMALRTIHLFVHAAKGIPGLVVVELWNCADGAPTCSRMAVFAGNRERSVRTACRFPLSSGNGCRGQLPGKKKQPAHNLGNRRRNCPLTLDSFSVAGAVTGTCRSLSYERALNNCTQGQ